MINALFAMLFVTVLYIENGIKREQRENARKRAARLRRTQVIFTNVPKSGSVYDEKTA